MDLKPALHRLLETLSPSPTHDSGTEEVNILQCGVPESSTASKRSGQDVGKKCSGDHSGQGTCLYLAVSGREGIRWVETRNRSITFVAISNFRRQIVMPVLDTIQKGDGYLPPCAGMDLGSGRGGLWDMWVDEPVPYFPYPLIPYFPFASPHISCTPAHTAHMPFVTPLSLSLSVFCCGMLGLFSGIGGRQFSPCISQQDWWLSEDGARVSFAWSGCSHTSYNNPKPFAAIS